MAELLSLPVGEGRRPFDDLIGAWPDSVRWPFRSRWLGEFEDLLRSTHPQASSRDRRLTARHFAPFYLAEGHDVP